MAQTILTASELNSVFHRTMMHLIVCLFAVLVVIWYTLLLSHRRSQGRWPLRQIWGREGKDGKG